MANQGTIHRLGSVAAIERRIRAGGNKKYGDGNGLWLHVRGPNAASWFIRWELNGEPDEMTLGPYRLIDPAKARALAKRYAQGVREGKNPREERDRQRDEEAHARHVDKTVAQVCAEWLAHFHKRGMSKTYTRDVVRSLNWYILPALGHMRIQKVDRSVILARTAIKEIWFTKKMAGWRLQQTGRNVWEWAKSFGYYKGDNPWAYDDALQKILPPGVHQIEKHRDLPAAEVPTFLARLRAFRYRSGFAKKVELPRDERPMITLMIEFAILNGCRIGEARQARWGEIDFIERVWHVPKAHLKNGRFYSGAGLDRPLTPEMMALLDQAGRRSNRPPDEPIFRPTGSPGRPPSELFSNNAHNTFFQNTFKWRGTVFDQHGFRTVIEDWRRKNAGEFAEVLIEVQTDHPPKGRVKRAYFGDTLLAERRPMMEAWCRHCAVSPAAITEPALPPHLCQRCHKPLPPDVQSHTKWCSDACQAAAAYNGPRKEKIRASNRASYQRHIEKRRAEKRDYWTRNRARLLVAKSKRHEAQKAKELKHDPRKS